MLVDVELSLWAAISWASNLIMSTNGTATNGLIPSDLYSDIPRFVDKKTLLEYMKNVDYNNNHTIAEGLSLSLYSFLVKL